MQKMKSTGQNGQGLNHFNCNECKDNGYIFKSINNYEVAIKCKCQLLKEVKSKMSNSGMEDLLEVKTFDNYVVDELHQKAIKSTAMEFTNQFLKGNRHSFAILGQSGVGKTHIMSAVARKLIDNNINVKYFIADEIIQRLQACKYDEENYNREFSKIANVSVLFIDDLFKSSVQEYYRVESINKEDLREIFKVINYRYNKKLPILLNSEIHFERFKELDQAIIGRINEMCQHKYLISIKPDTNKNYRLKKKGVIK